MFDKTLPCAWCGLVALAALAIAALVPAAPAAAQQTQVQRGEYLARAGDCISCHTAKGGAPYAGGLRLDTPFGYMLCAEHHARSRDRHRALVGRRFLSRAARRREQARPGHVPDDAVRLLHPGDARGHRRDLRVSCARSSRCAIAVTINHLYFPFDQRWSMARVARTLLQRGRVQAGSGADRASWNRGAYLVEGLGHCSDCHSPRNLHGRHREEQGLQRRRHRRLVRARPHVRHRHRPRRVDGRRDRDLPQDRRRTRARRRRWVRWPRSCRTACAT